MHCFHFLIYKDCGVKFIEIEFGDNELYEINTVIFLLKGCEKILGCLCSLILFRKIRSSLRKVEY